MHPTNEDIYWFERLDASYAKAYPKEVQCEAIAYFHAKNEFPNWLLRPNKTDGLPPFSKALWENHLQVLQKWLDRTDVRKYFIAHIDDPNWPGFVYVWDQLIGLGEAVLPLIDLAIAEEDANLDRREWLEDLKEEIEEGDPEK